jgi:2-polyprenyl-3-methyl-5-hydroxy-6-metoxy-1,4-benzoquinol methylase
MENEQLWDERYRKQDTPWENGQPHPEMQRLFNHYITSGQAVLEIGCGLGTNARWLAKAGYKVIAIDISATAITTAKQTPPLPDSQTINFINLDFCQAWQQLPLFPVIFDCAVLQVLPDETSRRDFVKAIAQLTEKNGYWINISCSKDQAEIIAEQTGVKAPPNLSAKEIIDIVEPAFEIIEIHRCSFIIH